MFDLAMFCDKHECSFEKIVENDTAAIFQLTGIANAMAAVYYKKTEDEDVTEASQVYFDMF